MMLLISSVGEGCILFVPTKQKETFERHGQKLTKNLIVCTQWSKCLTERKRSIYMNSKQFPLGFVLQQSKLKFDYSTNYPVLRKQLPNIGLSSCNEHIL